MSNIGFVAGPTLHELGPVADVQKFFDCLALVAVTPYPDRDWSLLTERLYRRYLRLDELQPAQDLMDVAKAAFAATPSASIDWGDVTASPGTSRLKTDRPTLADVFSAYFDSFADCRESAELTDKLWKNYRPLKIVVSDLPRFISEKDRPPEAYDTLEGEPFWKR
jgi:hypothetical protein